MAQNSGQQMTERRKRVWGGFHQIRRSQSRHGSYPSNGERGERPNGGWLIQRRVEKMRGTPRSKKTGHIIVRRPNNRLRKEQSIF